MAFVETKKNKESSGDEDKAVYFGCGGSHKLQVCKDTTKVMKRKIWKEINTNTCDWGYSPKSVRRVTAPAWTRNSGRVGKGEGWAATNAAPT